MQYMREEKYKEIIFLLLMSKITDKFRKEKTVSGICTQKLET